MSNGSKAKPPGYLSLTLRKQTPEPLKRLLRGVRLVTATIPPSAPQLPQEALDSCRFLASLTDFLDRISPGGIALELGSLYGDFSREILARYRPAKLHLVDVDFEPLTPSVKQSPDVELHRGLTSERVPEFDDESFDFIYVDADHSYEGVKLDIEMCVGKLKPGGILAFNDYARIVRPGLGVFGVHQAVSEFIVSHRWNVIFFCFNSEALYDIVLQKPD